MTIRHWLIAAGLALLLLPFQFCAPSGPTAIKSQISSDPATQDIFDANPADQDHKDFSAPPVFENNTGNGDVYTGKVQRFVLVDAERPCADDILVRAEVRRENGLYFLVKQDCDFLTSPEPIEKVEVLSDQAILFNGDVYVAVQAVRSEWAAIITNYVPQVTVDPVVEIEFESIGYNGNDPEVGFECALDGANWQSCDSPHQLRDYSSGPHYFQVRAVDSSDDTSLIDEVMFTYDSQDVTANSIDSNPDPVSTPEPSPTATPNPAVVQNFRVTCTSLMGSTQSVNGRGSNGIVVARAPSGQSAWVIRVVNNQVTSAYNCFANQAAQEWRDRGDNPQYNGLSDCRNYGPNAGTSVPYNQYSWGVANPFQSCRVSVR